MCITKLMQQAQQIRKEIDAKKIALGETLFEESAGGGAVKVSVYGDLNVHAISIKPSLYKEAHKKELEDMLVVCLNNVIAEIQEEQDSITYDMRDEFEISGVI